jgi:hypothetical protein
MKNREALQQLVLNTVHVHPEGVSHVQLVRYVLETGYRHPGDLSADLMRVVRFLSKQGVIEKNLETREIRSRNLAGV